MKDILYNYYYFTITFTKKKLSPSGIPSAMDIML